METPPVPTQFDCLKLNAKLVRDMPYDDVIFLLTLFTHLELECDAETDRLEALSERITWRVHVAQAQSKSARLSGPQGAEITTASRILPAAASTPLNIFERSSISQRYKVPTHIFGASQVRDGGTDLELLELEAIEHRIQNYMSQISELEAEIAAVLPKTPEGVMLKLRFLSDQNKEGSGLASDVLAFVVDQSIDQLSKMLQINVRPIGEDAA